MWVWSTVFVFRPTNRMSMAQGLFKAGPSTGEQPTRARDFEKYLGPRRHSSKERCLRRQANNLTRPKRVNAWGTPPEAKEISSAETHPTGTVQLTPRPAEVQPNNWRGAPNTSVWSTPLTLRWRVFMEEGEYNSKSTQNHKGSQKKKS